MVALDPPAPRGLPGGLAEDGEGVQTGVAVLGLLFQLGQDLLAQEDAGELGVAGVARRAAHEGVSEVELGGGHLLDGKTFALARDEVPVFAVGVVEGLERLRLLRVVERPDPGLRGGGHGGWGFRGSGEGG
jgi:hypothetical protein